MGIGQRVRAAHLSHFCPGGLGFPITSATAAGTDLADAPFLRRSSLATDHSARAAGETCARCGERLRADQTARRRVSRDWVHEACPPRCLQRRYS